MPAHYQIDKESQIITITWEGEVNNYEFQQALLKYQNDIRGSAEYDDYSEILDFCGLNGSKLTSKGLLHVAQLAAKSDKKITQLKWRLWSTPSFRTVLPKSMRPIVALHHEVRRLCVYLKAHVMRWPG